MTLTEIQLSGTNGTEDAQINLKILTHRDFAVRFLSRLYIVRHIMTIEDRSLQMKKRGEVNEIYSSISDTHSGAKGGARTQKRKHRL